MFLLRGLTKFVGRASVFSGARVNVRNQRRGAFGSPRGDGYTKFSQNSSTGRARLRWQVLVPAVGIPSSLVIYVLMHQDHAPYTGRRRMIDLSRAQERKLGEEQLRAAIQHAHVLPARDWVCMVLAVGQHFAANYSCQQNWKSLGTCRKPARLQMVIRRHRLAPTERLCSPWSPLVKFHHPVQEARWLFIPG